MSQNCHSPRRQFLATGLLGASTVLAGASAARGAEKGSGTAAVRADKVRYDELLPHEFRKRLAERPIAYLPLGTLEWHGEHLPLGSDAMISTGVMLECARQLGGIVMPPIYLAPSQNPLKYGQMTPPRPLPPQNAEAETLSQTLNPVNGNCYWVSLGFHLTVVDAILAQLRWVGFRAVFADGHGPSRRAWASNIAEREQRFDLKLFGVTPELTSKWKSQMDHAGRNETSLMLFLRPELADMSQLPPQGNKLPPGLSGQDPRHATAEHGKECLTESVEVVRQMFAAAGLL